MKIVAPPRTTLLNSGQRKLGDNVVLRKYLSGRKPADMGPIKMCYVMGKSGSVETMRVEVFLGIAWVTRVFKGSGDEKSMRKSWVMDYLGKKYMYSRSWVCGIKSRVFGLVFC